MVVTFTFCYNVIPSTLIFYFSFLRPYNDLRVSQELLIKSDNSIKYFYRGPYSGEVKRPKVN